jgi:hypothetical protein
MHEHIFEVMKNNVECLNGYAEGFRVVECIEACHRSAAADGEIIRM